MGNKSQPVKEPLLSFAESRGSHVIQEAMNGYKPEKGDFPTLICQPFQVHGRKFKPDPLRDGGQAPVVGITHGVFLLRIRKDPLNGFLCHGSSAGTAGHIAIRNP